MVIGESAVIFVGLTPWQFLINTQFCISTIIWFNCTGLTFGLRNASQSSQRYIFRDLGDINFVYVYIDHILIESTSQQEHAQHLKIVFQRLKDFSLRLNVSKCQFSMSELELLGHLIIQHDFKPTPEKVQAIAQFPKSYTVVNFADSLA